MPIRIVDPDLRLVLMVNGGPAIPADDALACGLYAYLREPFRLDELVLVLVRLSERRTGGCDGVTHGGRGQ